MKVVYIAGPFRGPTAWDVERNIRRAEELAFEVANLGAMPLCPHTNTRFFDGTLTGDFWLRGTMELLRRCDAMILTPDGENSAGASAERVEAELIRMPVFYNVLRLEAWLGISK
ncbi:MAG: DUF4406 domain-containing protein [bacterium]|nr:DUF4406 domain-containing protein [bacterium]